jgi:hypothetical protein
LGGEIAPIIERGEPRGENAQPEHMRVRVAPPADSLFEVVRDRYGRRLALVFGNHAPGGQCPYYAARLCHHCDIGSGEGAAFDLDTNRKRLAWFWEHYAAQLAGISHLVVYNSGSVLNPREMPVVFLDEIVARAGALGSLRVLSLDAREAYITMQAVHAILARLNPGITLRAILGIESADDRIRNDVIEKRMPRRAIDRVFRDLGAVASECGPRRIGLDVNVVIGAPGTREETAVDDAVATARFAWSRGIEHGVSVDLNLHPYYAGKRGHERFPGRGRASLATTAQAAARIAGLARSMELDASIFIGWQDEGHDRQRALRSVELAHAQAAFDAFNQTNEPGALDGLA